MAVFSSNKRFNGAAAVYIFASLLIIAAAFLTYSLLLTVLTYGNADNIVARPGRFLFSVYGFSSFLIPVYLFACAVILLIPGLNFRSCFLLSTSIIPFFTAYGGELLIRKTSSITGAALLSNIIFTGLLISVVLAVITEYLLLYHAALIIEKKISSLHFQSPLKTLKTLKKGKGVLPRKQKTLSAAKPAAQKTAGEQPRPENTGSRITGGQNGSIPEKDMQEFPDRSVEEPWQPAGGIIPEAENPLQDRDAESGMQLQDSPESMEIQETSFPVPEAFQDAEEEETGPEETETGVFEDLEDPDTEDSEPEEYSADTEIPPGLFDGYIAGNFSIIDTENRDEESAAESGTQAQAIPENPADIPVKHEGKPPVKKSGRLRYQIDSGILNTYPDGEYWVIDEHTHRSAAALKETLNEFNIQADVTGIRKGPVITMFEILPAPGVKLSRIVGLQDNIALRLAASSVRIVAPIPGKHAVGIEVPNDKRSIVSFKELIETDNPSSKKMGIPVMLGKDITGEAQIIDLTAMPHLLIAGSTGSGKSVCVNSIILSILYRKAPDEVKLILIDPKVVELKLYNDIGHLLSPVITEPKKAFQALQYSLCEMERRYAVLDGMGVRNIKEYNKRIQERNIAAEKLPYIVIIIDEFADLMATTGKELESTVARLAAMSRAVGIHLVLATQRPSIDVITGLIKANIPSRIAFMVASKMDSRIIIDQVGAEKLLGRGDMLYSSVTDPFPVRIQGAFVSDEEVERVVEQVKTFGEPEYIDDEIFVDDDDDASLEDSFFSEGEDPLYEKALDIVLAAGKASASYIQRRLKIGYNRAARLVEEMEMRGIVGPANGSKPREVIHIPERQTSG